MTALRFIVLFVVYVMMARMLWCWRKPLMRIAMKRNVQIAGTAIAAFNGWFIVFDSGWFLGWFNAIVYTPVCGYLLMTRKHP